MEYWSIGVLECWSTGNTHTPIPPDFHTVLILLCSTMYREATREVDCGNPLCYNAQVQQPNSRRFGKVIQAV